MATLRSLSKCHSGHALSFQDGGLNTFRLSLGKIRHIFQVQIDDQFPVTEPIYTGAEKTERDNQFYFGRGLIIKLQGKEENNGVQSGVDQTLYSINGDEFLSYTGPLTLFDREGRYNLRYHSVDLVGNSEAIHEIDFIVDYLSPESRHEFHGANYFYNGQWVINSDTKMDLQASDLGSGTKAIYYSLDDINWNKFTEPFAFPQNGKYTLAYYAIDRLNKQEPINKATLFVDNIAPDIQFEFSKPSDTTEDSKVQTISPNTFIYFKAKDDDSGIKEILYQINDGEKKLYRRPIVIFGIKGPLKITAYVRDWADNPREKTLDLIVNQTDAQ